MLGSFAVASMAMTNVLDRRRFSIVTVNSPRSPKTGQIRPLISERLPLESLGEGVQRLADGRSVGRIAYVAGAGS